MSKTPVDLEEYKSLDQLKKELRSLQLETTAATKTIERLLKDLSNKNEEIKHLQSLLSQTIPVIRTPEEAKKKVNLNLSAEEEIALIQLDRLRKVAQTRPLTLEETKIFDLLVKNKRLSQDESTINLSKASYRDVSEAALLQIASQDDEPTKFNK